MAINFPDNPDNGQTFMINNILYEYYSSKNYWRVLKSNDVVDGGSASLSSVYELNYDAGISTNDTLQGINILDGGQA